MFSLGKNVMHKESATATDRQAREHFVKTFAHHSGGEKRSTINKIMFGSIMGGMYTIALAFFCASAGFITTLVLLSAIAFLCVFCSASYFIATMWDLDHTDLALRNAYRSTALLLSASAVSGALRRTRDEQWADLETA